VPHDREWKAVPQSALASADGAAAYVDREWVEEKVREQYDWLFRYNVDEVPV
jgi:salicylate hydroxylase